MELRLLGPLEVLADGRRVPVARGREGALLAMLAINARRPVAVDRLVEDLWEGEPPEHAAKSVQIYVSRLRKALGNDAIATTAAGYVLQVGSEELDVDRFESLAREGKGALERGDAAAAERALGQALELWRGDPFGDFRFSRFAQEEIRRLDEARSAVEADYADALLELGDVEAAIPRLRGLIEAQPLWERPRAQLMLALYRLGRAAEALELYRSTHSLLDGELGLKPSSELAELHRKILNQDSSLGPPPPTVRARARGRRMAPLLALAGGVLLAGAAVVTALLLTGGGGSGGALTAIAPNSVGAIDPHTNRLALQVGVGSSPTGVAVASGRVWVADGPGQELVSVDPRKGTILRRIPLGAVPTQIAAGPTAVWVTNPLNIDVGALTRVDLRTDAVTRVPVRTAYVADLFAPATPNVLALDGRSVWTNTLHGRLVHVVGGRHQALDAGTGHSIDGVAVGAGSIWIASSADDTVLRFDPNRERLATPPIQMTSLRGNGHAGPAAIAYGDGGVWVAEALADSVTRIDPRTNAVAATIRVGARPTAVAIGEGGVWVLNSDDGSVTRIDPADNHAVATVPVGRTVTGIAAGAGRVWVTVAGGLAPHSAAPSAPARPLVTGSCGPISSGGTLPELLIASDFPGYDNGGRVNPPILDIRRAILAVLKEHGFHAGRYRVGLQQCTDSSPGNSPDFPLCAANARAYAGDPSVVAVVGTYQSACAMVELPVLDAAPSGPVALISPANTYVGLTHEGPQTTPLEPDRYYPIGIRNYVRLAPPDDAQGAGLALLAKQLHRGRLYLLDDGDPTAAAMVDYVARAATRLGLSVVGRAHWGPPSTFASLAQRVLRARPAAVVLTGCICSHGGQLLVTLRRKLGRSVPVLASDNFTFAANMAGPGAPSEAFGVYISGTGADPADPSAFPPEMRAFLTRVFPGRPLTDIDRFVPLAAAATQALLEAIRRSDGSRASIVAELTRGRASGTVLGGVSFDANGDPTRDPVSIYRISKAAPPGPHLAVSGLKLDRVIEADPALAAP
jgi:YVTN family beta-propeller protein